MIDAHTHVLPAMDDGSKDVGTSMKMLRRLKRQGADTVLATPHFYAERENPDAFLERRGNAMAALREQTRQKPVPSLRLGAEVYWFPGMGQAEALDGLCIEGTRLILVEMPFTKWSAAMLRELREIQARGLNPVLAHVDRYACFWRRRDLVELSESGLYLQVNADAASAWLSSLQVRWMMKKRLFQFLGSDCHNLAERKPNIGKAAEKLRAACGEQTWEDFVNTGESLIGGE